MTCNVKPVGHHLVIQPIEYENETDSGIIIAVAGSHQEKLEMATRMLGQVVAVGAQCWKAHAVALDGYPEEVLAPWAAVGDMVMYGRHAGKFIKDPITGTEYYLIQDEDVKAVLPPQDEWTLDQTEIIG
jgi:co-chaperonin GroES (HSP10)